MRRTIYRAPEIGPGILEEVAAIALGARRHRALIEHGRRYLTTGDPALGRR